MTSHDAAVTEYAPHVSFPCPESVIFTLLNFGEQVKLKVHTYKKKPAISEKIPFYTYIYFIMKHKCIFYG